MLVKFGAFDVGVFVWFFFRFFLNIGNEISHREPVTSVLMY
jgi:hypothetical protein